LIQQGYIHLGQLRILVLDEADRMLDMGFVNDVKKIIAKVPAKRQTLFFSATMPKEIQQLADSILNNPEKVSVAPVSSTADTVQQEVFFVQKGDKRALLSHILKDKSIETVLVFTRTKHGADKVVKDLHKIGVTAEAIHGNKSQNARQRALNNFKSRTTRVLIATDIAARGIDIDELTHVINYELPNIPETYVHRIGRTGRAGASGIALSFCDAEEVAYLKDIHKLIAKEIPVNEAHPYPMNPDMNAPRPTEEGKQSGNRGRSGSKRGRGYGRKDKQHGHGNSNSGSSSNNAGGNRNGGGKSQTGNTMSANAKRRNANRNRRDN
jgi:ATP-dependent RNA helicase RhlE